MSPRRKVFLRQTCVKKRTPVTPRGAPLDPSSEQGMYTRDPTIAQSNDETTTNEVENGSTPSTD